MVDAAHMVDTAHMVDAAHDQFTGAPAAPGLATGPAMVLREGGHRTHQQSITAAQADGEFARFERAISEVIDDLNRTEEQFASASPTDHGSIALALIVSHRAVLTDPLLIDGVRRQVQQNLRNAEWALECVVDELRNTMFRLDNPGLRDWWREVEAFTDTLLWALEGDSPGGRGFAKGAVAVATSLGITDAIELIQAGGVALVLERGSLTSHVAVLCRSAGLPAVVGVPDACSRIENGRMLVVDGSNGTVHHDDDALAAAAVGSDAAHTGSQVTAACGTPIVVRANLALQLDAAQARAAGTEGVGLMRTFYQYVGRAQLPSEDELAAVYCAVAEDFAPHPVTIRLLDLGGSFGPEALPAELHRLRDCRGIRLLRERPAVVHTQIAALCRASTFNNLRILVPFVTDPSEMNSVRALITETVEQLRVRGHGTAAVSLGAMVEVPSAVLMIDELAAVSDFLAVGTNDLTQYLLATPRDETFRVGRPLHDAVLRAIELVCEAGARAGIPVSLCGEIASEPRAIPALLRAGLRELSVAPRLAPAIIEAITALDVRAQG